VEGGEEKGPGRRGSAWRRLNARPVGRRSGAGRPGRPGRRGEAGGRAGEGRGGARPEVEEAPDRWAPPVGERREERGEAGAGGPAGLIGPGREMGRRPAADAG
jgi:hypothetical protein